MITIIEDEIRISRADYNRYHREYLKYRSMHAAPQDFEEWLRQQLEYKRLDV